MSTKTTERSIVQSNLLIMGFMGIEPVEVPLKVGTGFKIEHNGSKPIIGRSVEEVTWDFAGMEAQFDSSWDWLMPVVAVIELLNLELDGVIVSPEVEIRYGDCRITDEDGLGLFEFYEHSMDSGSKLGATFMAVVRFIEWYNQITKQ
jgi:hypothetical protein